MEHTEDFSQLRSLLASTKLEYPQDTQVDQFLIEFHRRQRAQLLVPQSLWSRAFAAIQERLPRFALVPSLSYASAMAAIAVAVVVGLSQQVQVTDQPGQGIKLSFGMANRDNTFALLPGTLTPNLMPKAADSLNFTPTHADTATTRFVLADNSQGAYVSTVAF